MTQIPFAVYFVTSPSKNISISSSSSSSSLSISHFAFRTSMLYRKYWFGPAAWQLLTLTLMQSLHRNPCSLINTPLGLVGSNKYTQGLFWKVRGRGCDFSEKGQRDVEKGKNIWKFGQKCTKFQNILKKGRWMCVIIACNKLLE